MQHSGDEGLRRVHNVLLWNAQHHYCHLKAVAHEPLPHDNNYNYMWFRVWRDLKTHSHHTRAGHLLTYSQPFSTSAVGVDAVSANGLLQRVGWRSGGCLLWRIGCRSPSLPSVTPGVVLSGGGFACC